MTDENKSVLLSSVVTDVDAAINPPKPKQLTPQQLKRLHKKMRKSAKRAGIVFRAKVTSDRVVAAIKQKAKNKKANKLARATRKMQRQSRKTSTRKIVRM